MFRKTDCDTNALYVQPAGSYGGRDCYWTYHKANRITSLDLQNNKIGDRGASALAEALKATHVTPLQSTQQTRLSRGMKFSGFGSIRLCCRAKNAKCRNCCVQRLSNFLNYGKVMCRCLAK